MTTDHRNVHVLVTGVPLPSCCVPSAANCPVTSSPSHLLLVQIARFNSFSGLSYVVWKCTSTSSSSSASVTSPQREKLHSQWIPACQVSIVQAATPDANAALGRGPQDSKFEVDNPRVALWSAKSGEIGRFTVAKQHIATGERVFQSAAFAVVVRQSLAPRRCHWCFALLRKKAFQCGACQFARYCSHDCMDADATLHDFQCFALRALKSSGDNVGDVETVRLALAVLSMEKFVGNCHVLDKLVVHRRDGEETKLRGAVQLIVELTDAALDPIHVQRTLERIRCNAHPLYLDGVTCVSTGVFPDAAMALNHSCLPNVSPSFDPRTRTLGFHAIVDIPRGHAVEYSYVELLQTRKRRRSLLASGFGFDCMCERCTAEAAMMKGVTEEDEEEETQAIEQLMMLVNFNHSDALQRLARLKKEHARVFNCSEEAQFALYTAELQLARTQGAWSLVVKSAEVLLGIWARNKLPENYHTTETLYMHIHSAAKNGGMTEKAKVSAQQVTNIRQICGYPHPETPIA